MSTQYVPYGFTIDGDELDDWLVQFKYEQEVKGVLDRIAQAQTGKILFTAMQATGNDVTIRPYTKTKTYWTGGLGSECNAHVTNTNPGKSVEKGKPVFYRQRPLVTKPLFGKPGIRFGEGKGIDVPVRFSASLFKPGGVCQIIGSTVPGSAGAEPDEVLFHELVHAYAILAGKVDRRPTSVDDRHGAYDDLEEFLAILLSNIYATDPNNPSKGRPLRADHHGFDTMAPAESTSAGFLVSLVNRQWVQDICLRHPALAEPLSKVPATFNPIRQLYLDTQQELGKAFVQKVQAVGKTLMGAFTGKP